MRLLHGLLLATSAMLPVACAAILGDDFEIVATGTAQGGGGSTGVDVGGAAGPGGAGGAAGAEPAPYYDCTWDFPEHRLVRSLEATPTEGLGDLFAARRGPDSVRAVVMRQGGVNGSLDIYTLDSSVNVGTASFAAREVMQVERLSSSQIGILYVAEPFELRLLVIDDSSPDGADADNILLANATTLPSFDPSQPPQAMMAPVPLGGLDDWDLDVVVSYRNSLNQNAIHYARYERAPSPAFVRITDPAVSLNDDDVQPEGMVHFEGTSYAYYGQSGASLGLRAYALDDTVTGFVTGTPIGTGEQLEGVVTLPPDYGNVAMSSITTQGVIRLHTGAVAGADLGSFDPADLFIAAEFSSQLDLPLFEPDARWNDDIFTLIGSDTDNSLDMVYYFLDNEGRERGLGPLDFTLILPPEEDRESLMAIASALRGDPLGAEGGTLHVLWTEGHSRDTILFDVLYYDRLRCTPR